MTSRLALLGVFIAALPLAVDLPAGPDSTRSGATSVNVAGGIGQFAIVSRGCNGEVLNVTKNQLASGALVVEHRFPEEFVIGVRAGSVHTTMHPLRTVSTSSPPYSRDSTYEWSYSNAYVNPYVGAEGPRAGIGIGWLKADKPFYFPLGNSGWATGGLEPGDFHHSDMTGHVYLGSPEMRLTARWMEDVPLESEGHLAVEVGGLTQRRLETGVFLGFLGPYDGVLLGLRGRFWVTPEAALQIKASVAGNGQGGVYGAFTTGFRSPQ